MFSDTIIAISSPPAPGGPRGIVRLSGQEAWRLARTIAPAEPSSSPDLPGWTAATIRLIPDASIRGALLFFRAPRSYTGEDIAELHLPGALPILRGVIDMLLDASQKLGLSVRAADAGEFTARAFFNGKMDLTQCEGIAATISATHRTQLRAAAALRAGTLHRETDSLARRLAHLLALVEAGIDFADEEGIHFIDETTLHDGLAALAADIQQRLQASVHIEQLAAPPTVAFLGRPNVGKSSLVNALAGTERSIVSPEAGTTRDILAATLATSAGEIRLLDIPGEEAPTDELRQKMMRAREQALLDADLVVEVFDAAGLPPSAAPPIAPYASVDSAYASRVIRVFNKSDLLTSEPAEKHDSVRRVSARTGQNLDALREELVRLLATREHAGGERLALNHRHRALLLEAQRAVHRAADLTPFAAQSPELLAAEMRSALDLLGQITGTISPDEVLGRIFSRFCIGK